MKDEIEGLLTETLRKLDEASEAKHVRSIDELNKLGEAIGGARWLVNRALKAVTEKPRKRRAA